MQSKPLTFCIEVYLELWEVIEAVSAFSTDDCTNWVETPVMMKLVIVAV